MSQKPAERRRVLYSGHVQGVGFRYRTLTIAQSHAVTGFVRNLSNGRVELVAEGSPAVLDALLDQVSAALGRNIDSAQSEVLPATGQWQSFTIA